MTDDRPRPQYGEYATPEQQAAAMGKLYVPPPAAETRVIVPGAPGPGVADEQGEPTSLRLGGNLIDRFVTIFQLGIGLVLLLSSDYFHFGENANTDMAELGLTQKIPLAIDQYGWALLAANIILLLATFVWAFATLRRGKLAFYIPAVGYLAFSGILGLAFSLVK
jgi:Family of unknown function (DUF6264)